MSGSLPATNINSNDGLLNISSTIRSLPNEMLCKVFLEYLPDGGSQVLVGGLSGTTIILSHVCSRWREVILGTPRSWSQLSLNLNENRWQERHPWGQVIQFISKWFGKAKDYPLKLRFGYQPKIVDGRGTIEEGCFAYFLTPLMERIQDLELDIYRLPRHFSVLPPNKFLQLECLVLHRGSVRQSVLERTWASGEEPLTIFRNAPRLQRLSMYFPLFGDNLNRVLMPWFQLTHLIIVWHMYPNVWEELLPQCINLTHGVFYIDQDDSPVPSRPKPHWRILWN